MLTGNDIAILLAFLAAAVAFAGATGIVASIDRRKTDSSSDVISFRARNLVLAAIFSILLSLTPILFDAFGIARQTHWQLACVLSVIATSQNALSAYSTRVAMRAAGTDRGLSRTLFVLIMTAGTLVVLVQLTAIAGYLPARGAFLLSLTHLLFIKATLFYRIVHMADIAARNAETSPG